MSGGGCSLEETTSDLAYGEAWLNLMSMEDEKNGNGFGTHCMYYHRAPQTHFFYMKKNKHHMLPPPPPNRQSHHHAC